MSKLRKQKQPEREEEPEESPEIPEGPKFLGMDYFRVIYGAAALLTVLMATVYFTVDDDSMY